MLNVIAVLKNSTITGSYYSYMPFPVLLLEHRELNDDIDTNIFPSRMQNLNGYPIRTIPDQISPRTVMYYDTKGNRKIAGYVAKMIRLFRDKLNATILYPFEVTTGTVFYFRNFLKLIANDTIDIGGAELEQSFINLNETNKIEVLFYEKLLQRIEQHWQYYTCSLFGYKNDFQDQEFLWKMLQYKFQKSILTYEPTYTFNIHMKYNKQMLIIVALQEPKLVEIIRSLVKNLHRIRDTPVIFIFTKYGTTKGTTTEILQNLFKICFKYKMLNVIAVLKNSTITGSYYSYMPFPVLLLEHRELNDDIDTNIFPSRMQNLNGYPIRTIPDQISPRTVMYYDTKGNRKIAGYVAKMIRLFRDKLNATILYPFEVTTGTVFYFRNFLKLIANDTIDIGGGIMNSLVYSDNEQLSYPLEFANWCVMVPVESLQTYSDYFIHLLNWKVLLYLLLLNTTFSVLLYYSHKLINLYLAQTFTMHYIDRIMHTHAFSGIMGFSFILPKNPILTMRVIYILLFFTGFITNNMLNVTLSVFLTHPPVRKPITTMDDFILSPLQILVAREEADNIFEEVLEKYNATFTIINTYMELRALRDSLNTSYAYPVTSSVWHVYEAKQQLFTKPLFRLTTICLQPFMSLGFPLDSNSIFRNPLEALIMRIRDMGFSYSRQDWTLVKTSEHAVSMVAGTND
ncbi:uncharacterized protein LOC119676675 [Teleopsis dalmanni]|uniref:uncharacterized protein LOC119676675 n=1 Tax=Teleopsis dalmanni TaxID=139649 RepID=UPI0018CE7822|nr:uncharacterized protein LOC119676675 [Teleopsis dalmanni]